MATQRPMLGRVTVQQVAGIVFDLLMKLGNDKNGWELLERIKLLLRGELPELLPHKEREKKREEENGEKIQLRGWQTVTVGGYPWARRLLWKIRSARCFVDKDARALFLSEDFKNNRYKSNDQWAIVVVKVTHEDLGFTSAEARMGVPLGEIVSRAQARGLDYCPTDVVSELCIRHHRKPFGSAELLIMTEPLYLRDFCGIPSLECWRFVLRTSRHHLCLPVLMAKRNPSSNSESGRHSFSEITEFIFKLKA